MILFGFLFAKSGLRRRHRVNSAVEAANGVGYALPSILRTVIELWEVFPVH